MSERYDVVVVGGGHNGLVCATYLAEGKRKVLVIEAADDVGGAAATRSFAPDFRVSSCAHLLFMLHPKIMSDLDLTRGAEALAFRPVDTVALDPGGQHIRIAKDNVSGARLAAEDIAAYPAFKKRVRAHAAALAPIMTKKPPRLVNGDWADTMTLAKLGKDVRFGLGKEGMRDFLRIAGINIFDVLNEVFDDDLLKGALSLDAVLGTHMGPRTPNTMLNYLYRLTGEIDGAFGGPAIPVGGMGAVGRVLAARARDGGAKIRNGARVSRIVVENGKAVGVEVDGERIDAATVVSNADPKATFLDLVGAAHFDAYFAHRVGNVRSKGAAAKLHLALDGLPAFNGLSDAELGQRLVIAPDMKYVERAYDSVKYNEYSSAPAIEITVPSLHDDSLAPEGKHVLSALVQYAPYELKGGWADHKKAFADTVIARIAEFAPGLRDRILHTELLTPADIEREFAITGGHWHHAEFAVDQLLMMRPVYGAAQYATPLDGLYLCGAGAHPGGGIMGAPGHNAAKAILAGVRAA